jgi:hypothetical protein
MSTSREGEEGLNVTGLQNKMCPLGHDTVRAGMTSGEQISEWHIYRGVNQRLSIITKYLRDEERYFE